MRFGYTDNFRDTEDPVVFSWRELLQIIWQNVFPMVKINVWLILFSIPVITLGPALVTAYACCTDLILSKKISFKAFACSIWKNFLPYWFAFLCMIVPILLGTFCAWFYFYMARSSRAFVIPGLFFSAASVVSALMFPYTAVMASRVDLKLRQVIKNAFLLAFLNWKYNFCGLLITFAILFFSAIYWAYVIPLTASITFALCILFSSYFTLYALRKYVLNESMQK